jgi:O-antigen/teichoic acid export membrane protein
MDASKNKVIAQNTIYLYTRTGVLLAISLLTSRFLLETLGVEELGIYNVVGGIVALMYFLRAAQAKATTRFVTFELGKKSINEDSKIYPICYTIHIILAIIVLIIGETLGFFILNFWTNIPLERHFAAQLVYHFSLFLFCINILRIPFDAVVISHENMKLYAYISIAEVLIQFTGVLLLKIYTGDRLVAYSVLLLCVSVIIYNVYLIVVQREYKDYKIKWVWNKKESVKVLSFSGWSLLGSTSDTVAQQGVSLLFNNFVNLVANTALGFAYQVRSAVGTFVGSFTMAFDPQIIKLTAENDRPSLQTLIIRASKLSFVLAFLMAFPLLLNVDFILSIWLGEVPEYTEAFCVVIIISALFDATSCFFNTAVNATGEIKNYQICISISFVIDILCTFLLLYLGIHPAIAFSSRIFARGFINMLIGLLYCHHKVDLKIREYFLLVIKPVFITIILSLFICYPISYLLSGWVKLLVTIIISTSVVIFCALAFVLTKQEQSLIIEAIKNKVRR